MTPPSPKPPLRCLDVANAARLEAGPRRGDEWSFRCPQHRPDRHPSLLINIRKNVWMCGPCNAAGTAWALAAFCATLPSGNTKEVARWLHNHNL